MTPAPTSVDRAGSRVRAWLQLARLPNLLTVPGDPLAGFLLAGASPDGRAALAMLASLCLYAAGLILNDLADLEIDRRERPDRPLPSGRIPLSRARLAAAALLGVAAVCVSLLGRTAALMGLSLALTIFIYDFGAKQNAWFGPLLMGLCRGQSLLLGAAAAGPLRAWGPAAWIAAAVLTLYVAGVTVLSRNEMRRPDSGPRLIAFLISLLLPLQAVFVLLSGAGAPAVIAGVVLLALWPANRIMSRTFYSS